MVQVFSRYKDHGPIYEEQECSTCGKVIKNPQYKKDRERERREQRNRKQWKNRPRTGTNRGQAESYTVWLNDRLIITAVAADEEEGWVEIIDPEAMAPLDLSDNGVAAVGNETDEGWDTIPTKRLTGKVELRKIS